MKFFFPLLHAGATLSPWRFSVHPSIVIGITALAVLYLWRAHVAAREGYELGRTKPALFTLALVVLFLSLNGWLHDLSDSYLFSAHMVQHLVLALVVAPMLIMATPGWMLRPALAYRPVEVTARWLTSPFRTFAIFNVVMCGWHLPPLYNLALTHHPVHIGQHLMFLVASVLMWWPILSPLPELPRIAYPMQMLYLFLMSIPMSIVAVYIAYADSVLYPTYAAAPRIWGISPMQDQLIGGLIMWIPGGLFFFAVISVIFFRWQQHDGDETVAGAQVAAGHLPVSR
ncbi:MAG TPA: cytochrome c oxidase assembly protein [Gemmatimonadaceae bacterium]|nr:cytochrome c oxidase assembly protein [Gemmatimonadaceae bacterium]